ncbi:hypothetical protein K2173_016773 [Erythroxylum novogranatense]|uniref:Galacturonokinase n=1 Tax=Erythroxylum novogranatense TaxID=1862640 RepID=A0AAV8SHK3_9ROSI|nr:hypothetical protein K2173_016773 [Erythroxylum novogranatense]
MDQLSWPSEDELHEIRNIVSAMSGKDPGEVQIVVSPYRISPLGAHIDHQGGTVTAMTINKGILLGFVPSGDSEVVLHSGQFGGEVRFSLHDIQQPRSIGEKDESHENGPLKVKEYSEWGNFARGAVYALKSRGNSLTQGITGFICGSEGLDSSGLSSSAAVGVAYLLAFEWANNLIITSMENIEYDRLIENEYLGLKNGILDQSAILLSRHGCLTCMNCKTKEHKLVRPLKLQKSYKILLAFSGLRKALTSNPGYNLRVAECREAASVLLKTLGNEKMEPLLCNVEPEVYKIHKGNLEPNIAKRAEHYFSENKRVIEGIIQSNCKINSIPNMFMLIFILCLLLHYVMIIPGLEAWTSGNLEEFGKLISASGQSSIENYECGCDPLIQLYKILLRAPGVYGARFSGAGFRGCCVAFVDADLAAVAASFVKEEYKKAQPELASEINPDSSVLVLEAGDSARVICKSTLTAHPSLIPLQM